MTDSRAKGSRVEREIAAALFDLTGISFSRNLEQVRSAAQGDLIPDDPDWPFSIEVKARAEPSECLTAWKVQAATAAAMCGRYPAVVMKFNNRPIKVAVPFVAFGFTGDEWATISLPGLAYLAAEIMARRAEARW